MEVDRAGEENKVQENNVLFEPAIYVRQDDGDAVDEAMGFNGDDDASSVRTNPGAGPIKVSGQAVDASVLQAAMVRCCICGIMTAANAANTCINCLKS